MILGISGSPRSGGNTEFLLDRALDGAREEGADTAKFTLAGKEIKPCDGCNACHRTGQCHIEDDMQTVYSQMAEAEGIIFATPVYFYGMTAQMKALIDRTYAPPGPGKSLTNKVGAIIAVAGSVGLVDVVKDLYFYFAVKRMLPGNWLGAYAVGKGDIENKAGALKAAHDMGREMVQLVAKQFEYPEGFRRSYFAFGTHTH